MEVLNSQSNPVHHSPQHSAAGLVLSHRVLVLSQLKKQSPCSLFRCSGLLLAGKVVLKALLLLDLCSLSTLITIFNLHKQHYLLPCTFAQCIINGTRLCSSSAGGCSTCCTQLAMQLFPLHLSHPEQGRGQGETWACAESSSRTRSSMLLPTSTAVLRHCPSCPILQSPIQCDSVMGTQRAAAMEG